MLLQVSCDSFSTSWEIIHPSILLWMSQQFICQYKRIGPRLFSYFDNKNDIGRHTLFLGCIKKKTKKKKIRTIKIYSGKSFKNQVKQNITLHCMKLKLTNTYWISQLNRSLNVNVMNLFLSK